MEEVTTVIDGAEPSEVIEPTEQDGAEPTTEETQSTEQSGAEPQAEQVDLTETMRNRINEVNRKAEEKIRQAEERALQAELKAQANADALARDKEASDFLAARGKINPYTNRVIDSITEFRGYKQAFDAETKPQKDVREIIREELAGFTKTQTKEIEFERQMQNELAEVRKTFPSVKTSADIETLPGVTPETVNKMASLIKAGIPLSEAVSIYVPKPTSSQKADTTGHLQAVGGQGKSPIEKEIPKEELAMWQESFPDLDKKELRKRYNNSLNR